jgi:N-acetylglucosaminyldiphosphoundecaprenol N-acetyl-beta-D-mannosaminyltransferase
MDVVLSGMLLLLLAPLLPLTLVIGQAHRRPVWGRDGTVVACRKLALPDHWLGRGLRAIGAEHWPLLMNILRGDIAFVGPRLRDLGEEVPAETLTMRPGLVNPWFIRRRTAVDHGTEALADAELRARSGLRHDAGLLLRGVLVALMPPPAPTTPDRVRLVDVAFDNLDMGEVLNRLDGMLDGEGTHQVSFVNPACVNIAARHRGYRRVLGRASLVLPDGIGVKIAGDLLGTPLRQNVNGTDLFPRLCERLEARGARMFLLGGQPGVAEGVAAEIARRWPRLQVVGHRNGFFSAAEEGAVVAEVRRSRADVLLVARGVPSQDLFIDRHLPLLGVKVAMGVGGLFDFVSGRIPRAPMWMRETGLEWIYRLIQEPGRMWRRYLVGNFTFLGRIGLQRLGLRRPQCDTVTGEGTPEAGQSASRLDAILIATAPAAADLPVDKDLPAALLPVGCQTLVEHVMDQLARAGVTDVHLVMCDRPETFRARLGDGSRWGLRLHWMLVKDARRPYSSLLPDRLRSAPRWLLGHADTCIDAGGLRDMLGREAMVMQTGADGALSWSGWAVVDPARLPAKMHDLDRADLAGVLAAVSPSSWPCPSELISRVDQAAQLLPASLKVDENGRPMTVPASWIVRSWGAMSPLAHVHPAASIQGPALIGPGCVVERDAVIGEHVVLTRDVVLSTGSKVRHTVVLPDTYVGADLDLNQTVVQGTRVRHLRLGVETTVSEADALLLDMAPKATVRPSWAGRAMAAALLAPALPMLAFHELQRRVTGRPKHWRRAPCVVGRNPLDGSLVVVPLCVPLSDAPDRLHATWATMAGLMDIVAGHRCWWGARPRSPGHWYALRPEWQRILACTPVGLWHAPAWSDHPAYADEAKAAADVFWATRSAARRLRLRMWPSLG